MVRKNASVNNKSFEPLCKYNKEGVTGTFCVYIEIDLRKRGEQSWWMKVIRLRCSRRRHFPSLRPFLTGGRHRVTSLALCLEVLLSGSVLFSVCMFNCVPGISSGHGQVFRTVVFIIMFSEKLLFFTVNLHFLNLPHCCPRLRVIFVSSKLNTVKPFH